jgi:hypothetical protein
MKDTMDRIYNTNSRFAKAIFDAVATGESPATILPMRRTDMAKGCVIRFTLGSRN